MTQHERPSDRLAKRRYSLPDRLKRAKPEGFSAAADYRERERERQRKKREAEESAD